MKRPLIFKLVFAWFCFALLIQVSGLTRPARAYQDAGEAVPVVWSIMPLAALAFGIWQVAGFFQLKRSHCWIATVFFGAWILWILWHGMILLADHPSAAWLVMLLFLPVVALNVCSIWYLWGRSFRKFAIEFRSERDTELMIKTAQKRVLDDVKS